MALKQEVLDKLRSYQKEALNHMLQSKTGTLMYDDMGLGKTLTTSCYMEAVEGYPLLIVCPKFALAVWEDELQKWFGRSSIIYSGKPKEREVQWKKFITEGHEVLITNFALLPEIAIRSGIKPKGVVRTSLKDVAGNFKWKGIVWDEAHMGGLFNQKTQTFKVSAQIVKNIKYKCVLTGTPYRKGVVDLYGPLHLVDPVRFDSYWKFVTKYCMTIETPFGKEIQRNPANIEGFRAMLKPYMVRRVKEEVLEELPGKLRQPLYVEMDSKQQKLYKELSAELMAEIPDTGELLLTPNAMTLIVRQKQILACPQVLGLNTRGTAIDTIIEHSHLRLDDNKPIAVFTPFRQAVSYIEQAFKDEYDDVHIYKIAGGLTAEEFGNQWKSFQNSKHGRRILICVIKSGASFQATAADTAYFLGYEEDFTLNEQAEDRLNRMGQKNFVNVYYLMHKNTVDEDVAARLNDKKASSEFVIGTETQYLERLRKLKGRKLK